MKPDTRQARAAAHPLELTRNVIRPERRTVLTAADVIALAVGFAVLFAVGVLSAAQIGQISPERVGQRQRPIAGFGLYAVQFSGPRSARLSLPFVRPPVSPDACAD